ncbi:MAG: glycosyltransferase [Nitrosopumilus sp.]|nr:glycosyltransferase [Nitrosopumilus sp.]
MIISVIIPFYNSEKYISEAIYSVINQTYAGWEIICVNNNSTMVPKKMSRKLLKNILTKSF